MESSRATPPAHAVVLFSGKHLRNWVTRDGQPARWKVEAGLMEVLPGSGDILTQERFGDFLLHLEFRYPDMPQARGQDKGNSGVFLQGRYELQILDSWGVKTPGKTDCGSFYNYAAPLLNPTRPPLAWQSFDVIFRAARVLPQGIEPARATVMQNGSVIHNNLPLPFPTEGALDDRVTEPGPLLLQDHGSPVAFRRMWIVALPAEG